MPVARLPRWGYFWGNEAPAGGTGWGYGMAGKVKAKGEPLQAGALKGLPPGKHGDGGGLYLLVRPAGRYWRLKYRIARREKVLALGVYPEVSLSEARARRDDAKAALRNGMDPSAVRRSNKAAAVASAGTSFGAVADEWLGMQKRMAPATRTKAVWTFKTLVGPWIGHIPVDQVTPAELLKVLRRIEASGAHETAHRTRQRCSQVFRFAIATGRATVDPAAPLRGALAPVKVTNRAAITDAATIGELMRAIDGYSGGFITRCALQMAALTFVRPGELRAAEWSEFDLDAAEWRIPAARMKMREEHIVPLSPQALAVLRELHPLTCSGRYLFPGVNKNRPMSEGTINAALRRMGFEKEVMTGHGFRAMASTRLNELAWNSDVIELQLAHAPRNKVRASYNRAQHLTERRRMMAAWADYLDQLKTRGTVVPIRKGKAG